MFEKLGRRKEMIFSRKKYFTNFSIVPVLLPVLYFTNIYYCSCSYTCPKFYNNQTSPVLYFTNNQAGTPFYSNYLIFYQYLGGFQVPVLVPVLNFVNIQAGSRFLSYCSLFIQSFEHVPRRTGVMFQNTKTIDHVYVI